MPLGSTILPKKRRFIEGLGADSIVDLKATLFNATEAQRTRPTGFNSDRPIREAKKPFRVNRGVSKRHAADLVETRDSAQSDINIMASLNKKASQYAQMNGAATESHNENCLVDFEYKQLYGQPGQDAHVGPEPASEHQALAAALQSGARQQDAADVDDHMISSLITAGKEEAEQSAHADKLAKLQNRTARARRKHEKVRAMRKQGAAVVGQQQGAVEAVPAEWVRSESTANNTDGAQISQMIGREAQEQKRIAKDKNNEWGQLRAQGTTFVKGTTKYDIDVTRFVKGSE